MKELILKVEQWATESNLRYKAPLEPEYSALKIFTDDLIVMKKQGVNISTMKEQIGDIIVISIISKLMLIDKLSIAKEYYEFFNGKKYVFNSSHLDEIDNCVNIAKDISKSIGISNITVIAKLSLDHIKQQPYYMQFRGLE